MVAFIRFKAFKWSAEFFMKQRDAGEDCGFLYTPASGMILIRLSCGASKPVYSFQLYPMIHPSKLEHFLFETMKKLPITRTSSEELYLVAKKILQSKLRKEFLVKDHGHAYVMFFDMIASDSKLAGKRKAEEIAKLADSKVAENPKAEEVVKLLKASPEVYLLRSSSKMEARRVKVKKVSCSICLEEVRKGENSTSAPCCHLFHRSCYVKWMISFKKSTCPLCRRSLQYF